MSPQWWLIVTPVFKMPKSLSVPMTSFNLSDHANYVYLAQFMSRLESIVPWL